MRTHLFPTTPPALLFVVAFLLLVVGGCVRRELTVTSDPPGALVSLNGQEFGRTPVTREFTWYGVYDVALRREGYETLKAEGKVIAPWWQWPPIDLVAELLPLTDRQRLHYELEPTTQTAASPETLIDRAQEMRGELRSGRHTREAEPLPSQ